MNILFSCDEYPPVKSGGIGTVTKIVAEELAKRGHNVYVLSGILPHYNLPEFTIINGVNVYRIKYFKNFSFLFKSTCNKFENKLFQVLNKSGLYAHLASAEYKRTIASIKTIVDEKDIHLIEIPDYIKLSDYLNNKKLIHFPHFKVPVIGRVHGSQSFAAYYRDGNINDFTKANDISFFNSVSKILAVSQFSADFVTKILNVDKKVDVIYNPLNLDSLLDISKNIEPDSQEKNIVFLGKIVETKGAFNLIKAFNKFSLSHKDYKLIMIGGGDIDFAKTLVNSEIKNRVYFTNYLTREDVCKYLVNATFCVVPSFFENFSMVTLEIMALGKALIYTTAASGKEVIEDGHDGILVNPHDVDAICEKMNLLASHEELLSVIGKNAAEKIKNNYTVDIIVNQLEDYYKNVIVKNA